MSLPSYTDIPANKSSTVPGTSAYYPVLNMVKDQR